ncbi:MAG: phosphatase PAP2 family protein [Bacteroidales bacterium]|nr:phosphatase PAP2 family protein [Bacteroidales bacterium]MDP3003408.1 phosphatase PAP2 family protein [Bacteroidales bacterium]
MLERLDQQLFLFLNSLNSPLWDTVMHAISGKVIWVPLYLAILIFLGIKYKRKFLVILLFIILAVTLADQISVLFKNHFQRLRPCHEPSLEGLIHLVNGECGGKFGFVSSHATNSFNVAFISLLFIKKRWYTISIILWALVVGYSRIYLGVHYPGDVICGSLLGALIGWSIYKLYELTDNKILQHRKFFNPSET